MQLTEKYTHDIVDRYRWLKLLIALLLLVVVARLFWLQVLNGEKYYRLSLNYSLRNVLVPAPRGLILDRNGRVVADNRPAIDLVIIPQYVVDWEKVKYSLGALLQIPSDVLDRVWDVRHGKPSYQPLTLLPDLSLDQVSVIRANKTPWYFLEDPYDLRGVEIHARAARYYKEGELVAHTLGYLKDSDTGEPMGANGLEAVYDKELRGVPGRRERIVNAYGHVVDYPDILAKLSNKAPVPGKTLQLTVDLRLQEAARRAFGNRSGAIVALDPKSGDVLAIYSSPGYNLSELTGVNRNRTWQSLSTDERHPLYNRSIQGAYPPGSTFKMVTALAGLMEGVITPDETVTCHGGMEFGGRRFGCWNKGGHGAVSLTRAIAESCDVYFYTVGYRLGLDRLAKYAKMLGLGKKTGIDLPHERAGNIPTEDWKQKRFGRDVMAGDVVSASIGQGYDTVTPLQDALMVARIVNGGVPIVPHIAKIATPNDPAPLPLNIEMLEQIRKGMEAVVNSPSGTAHRLASLNLKIAGKTGTAQTVGYESKVQRGDHAWFVGYAPYDDPKIVAAAIVEYGGHGGTTAAPIVADVIKAYLQEEHHVTR